MVLHFVRCSNGEAYSRRGCRPCNPCEDMVHTVSTGGMGVCSVGSGVVGASASQTETCAQTRTPAKRQ